MKKQVEKQLIEALLRRVLGSASCTPREKEFLESVYLQVSLGKKLSVAQNNWVDNISQKYDDDFIEAEREWFVNYGPEHHLNAFRMAQYYEANPPYYSELAHLILQSHQAGEQFKLPKHRYKALTDSKYGRQVLSRYTDKPRFIKGQFVQFSARHRLRDNKAVVLQVRHKPITKAFKGSIPYQVLPVRSSAPVDVYERDLKLLRRAKNG